MLVDAAASPGFTDEVVRVFLATGLSHPGRGESHDEEADMTVHWVPLSEAVSMVMAGEVVNAIAVAGILATYVALGVTTPGRWTRPGRTGPRPSRNARPQRDGRGRAP